MDINVSIIEQVQTTLAEALQTPIETITPELALGDLPQWDSMGHMEVMMLLEQKFNIEINNETITALVSVPAICEYLTKKEETS